MIRHYWSKPASPRDRGYDFGASNAAGVVATAERYLAMFASDGEGKADIRRLGSEAMASIERFSPDSASEIEGIAQGAGLPCEVIAAMNARTEIIGRAPGGECSTVVRVGGRGRAAIAVQTWDWLALFADNWLVWSIEFNDGRILHTLTEYGVLGKIGVSSVGIGLNLNLLHHANDGGPIRVPVHVLARCVLEVSNVAEAVSLISAAAVSASSALTVTATDGDESEAITAEVFPGGPRYVTPGSDGLLIHTNHFLDMHAAQHELENRVGPDSFARLAILQRRVTAEDDESSILTAMCSHFGGSGAVCSHPDSTAPMDSRYYTLATVSLHVERGEMAVRPGGPCAEKIPWWITPRCCP